MNLDKFTKITLIFSVLLVASSVSYYFVIFLPEKEEAKLELQKDKLRAEEQEKTRLQLEKEENKEKLETCLSSVQKIYEARWDESCYDLGLEGDCVLPFSLVDRWNKLRQQNRDDCYKKYPQK